MWTPSTRGGHRGRRSAEASDRRAVGPTRTCAAVAPTATDTWWPTRSHPSEGVRVSGHVAPVPDLTVRSLRSPALERRGRVPNGSYGEARGVALLVTVTVAASSAATPRTKPPTRKALARPARPSPIPVNGRSESVELNAATAVDVVVVAAGGRVVAAASAVVVVVVVGVTQVGGATVMVCACDPVRGTCDVSATCASKPYCPARLGVPVIAPSGASVKSRGQRSRKDRPGERRGAALDSGEGRRVGLALCAGGQWRAPDLYSADDVHVRLPASEGVADQRHIRGIGMIDLDPDSSGVRRFGRGAADRIVGDRDVGAEVDRDPNVGTRSGDRVVVDRHVRGPEQQDCG